MDGHNVELTAVTYIHLH